jgi:hypothetical protein
MTMTTTPIDLTSPSTLRGANYDKLRPWQRQMAWSVYCGQLAQLDAYGMPSVSVCALVATGVDALVLWLTNPTNAPEALLRTAAANFRVAKQLARREGAQRRRR